MLHTSLNYIRYVRTVWSTVFVLIHIQFWFLGKVEIYVHYAVPLRLPVTCFLKMNVLYMESKQFYYGKVGVFYNLFITIIIVITHEGKVLWKNLQKIVVVCFTIFLVVILVYINVITYGVGKVCTSMKFSETFPVEKKFCRLPKLTETFSGIYQNKTPRYSRKILLFLRVVFLQFLLCSFSHCVAENLPETSWPNFEIKVYTRLQPVNYATNKISGYSPRNFPKCPPSEKKISKIVEIYHKCFPGSFRKVSRKFPEAFMFSLSKKL